MMDAEGRSVARSHEGDRNPMTILRKAGVVLATSIMSLGVLGAVSPAEAKDTSWGCGGFCRTAP
jgi:hypothetical protein